VSEPTSQTWYRFYASVAAEVDKRVIERVEATEAAIQCRLRDLQYDSDHHEERQLIADAQAFLAFLRCRSLDGRYVAGSSLWKACMSENWQILYRAALVESDPNKIEKPHRSGSNGAFAMWSHPGRDLG
jgi:hypothetical protein